MRCLIVDCAVFMRKVLKLVGNRTQLGASPGHRLRLFSAAIGCSGAPPYAYFCLRRNAFYLRDIEYALNVDLIRKRHSELELVVSDTSR
jgi:hypothetical protein